MARSVSVNPNCSRKLSGSFEWKISNFSAMAKATSSESPLLSPTYSVVDTAWPGHSTDYLFQMSLYQHRDFPVARVKCLGVDVDARYRVRLLDTVGELFVWGWRGLTARGFHITDSKSRSDYSKAYRQDLLRQVLTSATLTFGVELDILVDPFKTDPAPILDETQSFDLALKCATESIPCHKTALAAHSSVFEDMFELSADDDKELTIPEEEPIVVKKMLEFIYSNNIDPAFARDLYVLANKFDMWLMKKQVMCALAKTLTTDNVMDVLVLFKTYGCEEKGIEDYAYKYAARNLATVLETTNWSLAMNTHPGLIYRVKEEARRI